jgi:hypothetical protein
MNTSVFAANLVQNILAIILFFVCLFIAIRAFYVYSNTSNPRIFILGTSMGMIALTAAADFFSSNVTSITLNTDWFLFIGQSVSFLFILLSFVYRQEEHLNRLMRLQVVVSALLLALLFLAPSLPPLPGSSLEAVLSGSRVVMCFIIFIFYMSAFMAKRTSFSLLMSMAFLLLAIGYLLIVQKYFVIDQMAFDQLGDIVRMGGLILLLAATFGK